MIPRSIVKDHAAEADLIGIWIYTFQEWSEAQANRYLDAVEKGINRLASKPEHGKSRDTIRQGYWSERIGHHVVFYTFTNTELRIRRVLHEVMDPDLFGFQFEPALGEGVRHPFRFAKVSQTPREIKMEFVLHLQQSLSSKRPSSIALDPRDVYATD